MTKKNPRILVIEDNKFDIAKIVMKLERYSNEVTYTTSAESGLIIYKGAIMVNRPYDILLTDILLPGKDGKELIQEIRTIEKELNAHHIKIIAMSADKPEKHVLETCKLGAGGYLIKPISDEKLDEVMMKTGLI